MCELCNRVIAFEKPSHNKYEQAQNTAEGDRQPRPQFKSGSADSDLQFYFMDNISNKGYLP